MSRLRGTYISEAKLLAGKRIILEPKRRHLKSESDFECALNKELSHYGLTLDRFWMSGRENPIRRIRDPKGTNRLTLYNKYNPNYSSYHAYCRSFTDVCVGLLIPESEQKYSEAVPEHEAHPLDVVRKYDLSIVNTVLGQVRVDIPDSQIFMIPYFI